MNLVERFKMERIAINCETEQEANKFIDWCYDNGIEFKYNEKQTYFGIYKKDTHYAFNSCENGYLGFSDYEFYNEQGYKIIKYKDYFKEGYYMKNFEKFKKEIADLLVNSDCTKEIDCEECENGKICDLIKDNPDILEKWFFEEYKEPIKLTDDDKKILEVAYNQGYKWIAKDEGWTKTYFFEEKPTKDDENEWCGHGVPCPFVKMLSFLKNDELYNIEELLKEN